MQELIYWLENIIRLYGWAGLLLGTLLEEIIIPLPSSLIMMGAGFFLIQADSLSGALGQIVFPFIPVGLVGVMAGSLLWYGLAYRLQEPVVQYLGKYLGVSWQEVKGIERYFQNTHSDEWVLFALRAIPIFPGAMTAICMGLIRMPLKKFLIFGGLGTAVRLGIMAFLGWLLQETYAFYAYRLESLSAPAAAALAIGFIAAYLMVKKKISLIVIDKP